MNQRVIRSLKAHNRRKTACPYIKADDKKVSLPKITVLETMKIRIRIRTMN